MPNISRTHIYTATRFLCSGVLTYVFNSCLNLTAKEKEKDKNILPKLYLSWCLANFAIILANTEIKNFSNDICKEFDINLTPIEKVQDIAEFLLG